MRSALVGTTQPASASFRGLPLLPAAYPHSHGVLSEIRRRATVVGILPESKIGRVGGWTTPLRVVDPAYLPPLALRLLQALHRSSGSSQFQVRSLLGRVSFSPLEVIRTRADERVRDPGASVEPRNEEGGKERRVGGYREKTQSSLSTSLPFDGRKVLDVRPRGLPSD